VAFLSGLVAGTWPELAEQSKGTQSNNFVLMGHSIGAYISLKTWFRTANTAVKVTDAFLLMPTICELYKGYSTFNRVRPHFLPILLSLQQSDPPP
jgi:alpha-beta hydrolase superfamily lysophospholipase